MKDLLRSILVQPGDDAAQAYKNYLVMYESGQSFTDPRHERVWDFVKEFASQHHHSPDLQVAIDFFQHNREIDVTDQLTMVTVVKPLYGGNFVKTLETEIDNRRRSALTAALQDAAVILTNGLIVGKGTQAKTLRGPFDSMNYLREQMGTITLPGVNTSLYGEVVSDAQNYAEWYRNKKLDPSGQGLMSGLDQMDIVIGGARKNELWIHAGFTSHLKSSLMITWAYNQAIFIGKNILLFSLEMDYLRLRNIIYAMHSAHWKFRDIRIQLGIQKDLSLDTGLSYDAIRNCELTDEEEQFLLEIVVPDLTTDTTYGKLHIEVADPDKMDFTILDLRARAEVIHQSSPIHMIFVDHMGLMGSRTKYASTTDKLNEVIRDLKKLTGSFNHGQGIPIVSLMQINREGAKAIEKAGGVYSLTSLSYANEAERSADIVTATYITPEMRKLGFVQVQCMKNRDGKLFDSFFSKVDWNSRRLLTCNDAPMFETHLADAKPQYRSRSNSKGGRQYTPNLSGEVDSIMP